MAQDSGAPGKAEAGGRCSMQEPGVTVIISITPQSRASLAAAARLSPRQCQAKLASFFKSLGAARVLDLEAARDLALLETAADFVARYRSREAASQLSAGMQALYIIQ